MGVNMKRQWYYRGSLKSCNYACSYCPFSKKKGSRRELEKDRAAWFRFVKHMNAEEHLGGAIQVVPYGEALIHSYYWEGLAALSKNPRLDAVGAQTNLSFPAEQMLSLFQEKGGETDKLRLWGTFHPEMTTVDQFVSQCELLTRWHISYCVGAVGNPANEKDILHLRAALPPAVYLWINKMDGLKRQYTPAERNAFLEIDPYFEMELAHHVADETSCHDNRFVEADGTMGRCNLCPSILGNLYHQDHEIKPGKVLHTNEPSLQKPGHAPRKDTSCARKECSCYLAYCNRKEDDLLFFQPYPAFRIPSYPKATFFDVDGTLIPQGQTSIPEKTANKLRHLARHSAIYLATSRPYETAKRGLGTVWDIISGGTFGNGGRRMIWNDVYLDEITEMDTEWLAKVKCLQKTAGFRVHTYKKEGQIYKVTLTYRKGRIPKNATATFLQNLALDLGIPESCLLLWEEPCLQITAKDTGKLHGVLRICEAMGYRREEVAVFGNGENDAPMLDYFPRASHHTIRRK